MEVIMLNYLKMLKDDRGMGTIEVVIIIAVLVLLGFLFKDFAIDFFSDLTNGIETNSQIDQLFPSQP
jgi:hypothetical protein